MADESFGFIVTRAGLNALAQAIAGKQLLFTRVALGDCELDGQEVEVTDEEAYEATGLVHWKKDLLITGEPTVGEGIAYIKFAIQNSGVTDGFWMCEMGIFAADPANPDEEILYAYEYRGKRGGWLPPSGGNEIWQQENIAAIAVAQAENISAVVDSGLLFVTQAEFNQHVESERPHPNTPTLGNAVTTTNYIWAAGSDGNLHPMSIDNFTRQALGGDAAQLPLLNSRISQTEVNIANLFTQLNAENDLGVKPNLLITDDFQNPTNIDFYRQPVITSVAGISNVRVASLEGLNAGSWYTISDGAQNEFVQVKALAQNGGASVAILNTTIQNTYNLPDTKLYRTTLNVEGGVGQGAGDVRSATYPYTFEWRGTAAGESSTLTLNTTLANKDAFTLSGDWAFSANGEFTLA